MGTRGAVASAHPLASMAGIRVLLEGGNAVDAAVAIGSTLNVVEPFMSSAGGIGLMFISRARTRERHVLDFIGPAPLAADALQCTEDELAGGPKACATPGNLGGWLAALERFGSMPRARVLAPAIELAEHGVPLTFANVKFFEQARATLGRSAEAGGWLSEADLAAFTPEWRQPLAITYRGREVCSVPPPFSAFQMLETLNILEGYDMAGWGHNSPDYLHHLIEAIKIGSADRLAYA